MGKSFQISKVLLLLCLCVAMPAKDVVPQTSSIKIGGSCFPFCETAFETIGVFHLDSMVVVRNTYKQNIIPLVFWEQAQCTDYYLLKAQDTDLILRHICKLAGRSCENMILLGFSEAFMESLYLYDELLPNYGIKDSLLAVLMSDNRWHFKASDALYHDLSDSLVDNQGFISIGKNCAYNIISRIHDFLLLRMTVFEYKTACQNLCSCGGASVSYPIRDSDKRKIVFVAVPISKKVLLKFENTLMSYYIENPWIYCQQARVHMRKHHNLNGRQTKALPAHRTTSGYGHASKCARSE